jgi:DNA repair exonuclease SbcCD nuclease subunit
MPVLITSDLHLTDKPQDEYRWGLFAFLHDYAYMNPIDKILLLGDTTDAKDKHSSKLVNRVVQNIIRLSEVVEEVLILRGNHDYIDPTLPYFGFLNNIRGIKFIVEPYEFILNNKQCLAVPNMPHFSDIKLDNKYEYMFCHQTFTGAVAETGTKMEGVPISILDGWNGKVISGDIHVPQLMVQGKIIYVGSPYHVHFGDRFVPRILYVDDSFKFKNLYFKTVKKHTIDISSPEQLYNLDIAEHDQVKIRLALDDIIHWEKYKESVIEYCVSKNIDLQQIEFVKQDSSLSLEAQKAKLKILTPKEILRKYCESMKVGEETMQFGMGILEDQTNDHTTTLSDRSD